MKRKIITIDQDRCNGCGLCVNACHEGALKLVNGKAQLTSESYCDGLGACLPACPMDAIHIEEREAAVFDEKAVEAAKREQIKPEAKQPEKLACGCPGTHARTLSAKPQVQACAHETASEERPSMLRQWPCQIKLVPANAPYFRDAHLLVAADCSAYAFAGFHEKFMRGRITLIGCPKLDQVDYKDKLLAILQANSIKSVTVVRMEVPCCGGIVAAVTEALKESGKMIPWQVVTLSTEGEILED